MKVSTDDCWLFAGHLWNGYGQLFADGLSYRAHRVMYENMVGEIPEGLVIDHLCRTPSCINPTHLEPVTRGENVRRGDAGKHMLAKTHCPAGHEYSPENTYIAPDGRRRCNPCIRVSRRKYNNKIKELSHETRPTR